MNSYTSFSDTASFTDNAALWSEALFPARAQSKTVSVITNAELKGCEEPYITAVAMQHKLQQQLAGYIQLVLSQLTSEKGDNVVEK